MKQKINSDKAAPAVGPYSQAIDAGPLVFLSGQIPLDSTGAISGKDIETQTIAVFKNISEILAAASLTLGNVIKYQVFMTNLGDFSKMNGICEQTFKPFGTFPARTTVQVGALPKGVQIEIDVVAVKNLKK